MKKSEEGLSQEELEFAPPPHLKARRFSPNPIGVDIEVINHFLYGTTLPSWTVRELAARSAERIRNALVGLNAGDLETSNPYLSYISQLISHEGLPQQRPVSKRSNSIKDFYKRWATVGAVIGTEALGLKGDDKFLAATEYLNSIGFGSSEATVRKNYMQWRHSTQPHESFMNFWKSEVHAASLKYLPEVPERD